MIYFLIISDNFGRGHGYDVRRYNLNPFSEIIRFVKYRNYMSTTSVMLNLIGNVVAFMPFGMLIRWARNKKTGVLAALIYSMMFSSLIEVAQFITKLGVFDVDDIIMNTVGGMLGYLVYVLLAAHDKRRRKHNEKQRIQGSAIY
jgi:glycopeptide antibiotics resistance protein